MYDESIEVLDFESDAIKWSTRFDEFAGTCLLRLK